jgi:hypothetical protein
LQYLLFAGYPTLSGLKVFVTAFSPRVALQPWAMICDPFGVDLMEVHDELSVLIGQLPLERFDFVVDLRNYTLFGNPAHGGEHIYELY